ncbi:MAG: sodium-dependent bicarbonate transport family permease, partial [Polyangiaceae bacterium]|nr:sodium-dependent bicarbonate transport family permease [Polyangiaceae bacterium]
KALEPFVNDLFKGFLCLFLLDMGLSAGRHWSALKAAGGRLIALGIVFPLLNAAVALALCSLCNLGQTDTAMLTALAASASYIAVPAAVRLALPSANPGLYLGLPLGVTFPFNITVGIPLYLWLAQRLNG